MAERIAELTERIYREGVDKAKQEAVKIIAAAKQEKKEILSAAQAEATRITDAAHAGADELRHAVESDVRLAAQKAITTLKQSIASLIAGRVSADAGQAAVADREFVQTIVASLVERWDSEAYTEDALVVRLAEKDAAALERYLFGKIKQELKKKITVTPDRRVKAGFVIQPADGRFTVGFTDEDFKAFFEFFLRARVRTFLFEG